MGEAGRRMETVVRPVIIAVMTACLAAPAVRALQLLIPGWNGTYFLVLAFLASLEGILVERLLRRRRITGWEYLLSRFAEIAVLLLFLKLASYLTLGMDQFRADFLRWPPDAARLFGVTDVVTGFLLLALWVPSLEVGRLLLELDEVAGRGPAPADRTSVAYYLWQTGRVVAPGREDAVERLGVLFLIGAFGLLLASAAVYAVDRSAGTLTLPGLLYFILGIGLLSQAQFSLVRAGWQIQEIPVQEGIGRRWLLWAVAFVAVVALLALLLPSSFASGPLRYLQTAIAFVAQIVVFLLSLLLFLLAIPLSLLFPAVQKQPLPKLPSLKPPGAEQAAGPASSWLTVLGPLLFWLLVLAVVGYALIRFWRDRRGLWARAGSAGGSQRGWRQRLRAWLSSLWQRWRLWRKEIEFRWVGRLLGRRELVGTDARPARLFSWRQLPARELIRYFYVSTIRRAAAAGQPRAPGETPYEYQAALDRRFPDLEPDLDGLTGAFIHARYSPQPVAPSQVQAVKPLWERIKAALRRRVHAGSDDKAVQGRDSGGDLSAPSSPHSGS